MIARAALLAAAGLASAAFAQEAASGTLVCRPAGYDVVVVNEGPDTLLPGTIVAWEVPFARASGTAALTAPLPPGGQIVLTAVLGSTYLAGPRPCTAQALPASGVLGPLGPAVDTLSTSHRTETLNLLRG